MVKPFERNHVNRIQIERVSTATAASYQLCDGQKGCDYDCANRWRQKFVLSIAGAFKRRTDTCNIPTDITHARSNMVIAKVWHQCRTSIVV